MESWEITRGETFKSQKSLVYSAPAIVYEGKIEARAGSLITGFEGEKDVSTGFDPADLFGGDN